MIKLKILNLSPGSVVLRFYLMMAVVVIFGFLNQWILATVLSFIVAVSSMAGISVNIVKPKKSSTEKKNDKSPSAKKERNTWQPA